MTKTPTGVDFFDSVYGGTYDGRVMLVTGRAGSGKSTLGLQFIKKGLEVGDKVLMLSAKATRDLAIQAGNLRLSVDRATAENRLLLLEYQDFIPGRDREENIMLPPDGFQQLKNVIEEYSIRRVVLDSVLPWVTMTTAEHLPEHVFSFVRAVERLGVTALFGLPKPVSQAATRLRRLIEDLVPVSVTMDYDLPTKRRLWVVNKYLGHDREAKPTEIQFEPGIGWVASTVAPVPVVSEPVRWVAPPAAPVPPVAAQPVQAAPPRVEPEVRPTFVFAESLPPRVVPPPPPPVAPPPPPPEIREPKERRISFADIMLPNR
jgi:KaiC/GvpD/RAD55 family RecA-like ATPase